VNSHEMPETAKRRTSKLVKYAFAAE